jgi:hypothetical protein
MPKALRTPIQEKVVATGGLLNSGAWTLFFQSVARFASGQLHEQRVTAATAEYMQNTDVLLVDYTATGAVTITLPEPSGFVTKMLQLNDTGGNAAVNNITVDAGASTINGAATYTMNTNYESLTLYCDGTEFFIV